MHKLPVVVIAALCVIGTSSLALADESLKSDMSQMNDDKKAVKSAEKAKSDAMKAEEDAMESGMGRKGGKKGPIMQHREKMKAKRHEMMEKMKAHREAAKTNPTAPAPVPAPAITPAP